MIKLDLANSSETELERILMARCSKFGSVMQTVIMRDGRRDFAFGLVVMSDPSEGLAVLRALGDTLIKRTVVIRLEQAEKRRTG
ncbi:hypothetical protein D3C83_79990 [compost metagenome]